MTDIRIIEGGIAVDDRGTVSFVNGFDFAGVKRFYTVTNFSTGVIRAFHGHMKEGKYVHVVRGAILLAVVRLSDTKDPDRTAPVSRIVLSGSKPAVVFVPPGHANGFRVLDPDTEVVIFSTSTLEESKGDDHRFPADHWGAKVWEVENR